jgi:uncharacterized protein (TIGR03435 family)
MGLRVKVTGGPSWVASEPWDVQAKAEDPSVTESELKRMLQVLIAERFKLQFHSETNESQGFILVTGKSAPKLTEDHSDAPRRMYFNGQDATFQNARLEDFARFLSGPIGAPVFDKTGLEAAFRFEFHIPPSQSGDADSPSIFTAVQEQLGLRLESTKVSLDAFVIDHVEKPTEN